MRVDLLLWWVKQPKNAATHAPLTYKQQHHAHQEHTTHLTRVATRQWPLLQDREVFDTLGATILRVVDLVVASQKTRTSQSFYLY
jgi:hypothetical protein